ncbi:hypothetical protein KC727_01425 [Candidatus Kaiserbacteria bacterium]|nr:hypothetical protein [Candidatus Kaiserbacteria bacterium]
MLRRFAQRVAQYAYAKDTYRGYTVVFDEGLLQRLHGLFIFSPTRFDAEAHYRLVQCMPPVDTVILLRQDTPNAQARIMKRGVPHRWRGKSKEEVEQYLEHTQKLISDVVSQQKTLTRRFLVDPTVEVLLNAIAYGEE